MTWTVNNWFVKHLKILPLRKYFTSSMNDRWEKWRKMEHASSRWLTIYMNGRSHRTFSGFDVTFLGFWIQSNGKNKEGFCVSGILCGYENHLRIWIGKWKVWPRGQSEHWPKRKRKRRFLVPLNQKSNPSLHGKQPAGFFFYFCHFFMTGFH